jgi:hypothetical protein
VTFLIVLFVLFVRMIGHVIVPSIAFIGIIDILLDR